MPSEDKIIEFSPDPAPDETVARSLKPASNGLRGWRGLFAHRFGGVCIVLAASLVINAMTRIALALREAKQISWDASVVASFFYGTVYDLAASLWWAAPLAVFFALVPRTWLTRKPARILAHLSIFVIINLLFFGAVSEWTLLGRIQREVQFHRGRLPRLYDRRSSETSANPIRWSGLRRHPRRDPSVAYVGLVLRTGIVTLWLTGRHEGWRRRYVQGAVWLGAAVLAGVVLDSNQLPAFRNTFNRELGKNGLWALFAAFRNNELDYDQFYSTLPVDHAFSKLREELAADGGIPLGGPRDTLRYIRNEGPELRLNVIQITVESLSADFLSTFNRASRLTPNLGALAEHSLVFENLYATGTRTDRGMEALTLSLPPTPGRSLIKRPRNDNLFTPGQRVPQPGL
jgi:hypothetical protein